VDPAASPLARLLGEELSQPAGEPSRHLAEEIQRRHAGAVAAILFYGSCLRRGSAEGVLDFYVLVDSYRAAYGSRLLALANAVLPPNVLYCEIPAPDGAGRLRCKYAVMTLADFARAAAGDSVEARVWARFAQPAALVYARDTESRAAAIAAVVEATTTNVGHALSSLGELERRGLIRAREEGPLFVVESDPVERARHRRAWRLRRPLAKVVAFLKLVKTSGTFDDWVPYILWKVERHSGEPVEVTERQRRHPLIFGWPVLFRLIRRRVLR
jgi:hypothetical protein